MPAGAVTTVLVARHGETDWNRSGRRLGQADPPLNGRGRAQARALAERLEAVPLAAIYSSDLRRALETARLVAARKRLPVRPLRELREIDAGSWTGLTRLDTKRLPAGRERRRAGGEGWEHGESYAQLGARVLPALKRIAAAHPRAHILVVSHDGPIRVITAHARGEDYSRKWRDTPSIEEGTLTSLVVDAETIRPQ